ncbi:MAG: type 1 glutamine amidotransferase [Pseudomonadota bacterium]
MKSKLPAIEVFCFAEEGTLGTLAPLLETRQISFNLHRIRAPQDVPETIHPASALIVMGGPMSANDSLPWIPPLLALLAKTIEDDIPVLGICLGAQLMARSLGAEVYRNPQREMGWGNVEWVNATTDNQPSANKPSAVNALIPQATKKHSLPVFHFHGETFGIPQDAQHLLTSPHCLHQGFTIRRSLALQCHIEPSAEMITAWTKKEAPIKKDPARPQMQTQEGILRDLPSRLSDLAVSVNTLFLSWLGQLFEKPC